MIEDKVTNGDWNPIKMRKTRPSISHLMFADDLILILEALVQLFNLITECLQGYVQPLV